ncbi:MAG: hypothetical protein JXA24_02315 [Proteobacteria bacterium]|nr:hypothetical protein [Pseudomonadota bacterium]
MLVRIALFGVIGVFAALVVSAARKSYAARRMDLDAETSLLLFPFFGLIALIYPIIAVRVSAMPWYGRGAVYMIAFFAAQYAAGLILTKLNRCPWNYSGRGSLGGLVRVSDAPLWFAAGLGVEHIYPWVKATAVALS